MYFTNQSNREDSDVEEQITKDFGQNTKKGNKNFLSTFEKQNYETHVAYIQHNRFFKNLKGHATYL